MLKSLPHGVKISIARSISVAFEKYMESIQWSEQSYDVHTFIKEWRQYTDDHASWLDKLDEEVKNSQEFHEELAQKINETIEKILTEEPTAEQIEEIEKLIAETGEEDVDFSCKSEAKFHIERLTESLKKKKVVLK